MYRPWSALSPETPALKQYNEALVEAALDAIIAANGKLEVTLFNAAAEKMFGCSRLQALGSSLRHFFPQSLRAMLGEQLELAAESPSGGPRIGLRTIRGRRHDASEFPVEASISRVDTSEGPMYTLFLRDITDRYRAEQALARSESALKMAQELAGLSHAITSPQGTLESCSDTFQQLVGLPSHQLPASLSDWLALVHPDDRPALRRQLVRAARSGLRCVTQYRLRREDATLYLHHVMDPLPSPPHPRARHTRWFSTLQDITESKQAEFKIRALNRVLSILSGINALILRAATRDELLQGACRIAVETGQFPRAWIGLITPQDPQLQLVAGHGLSASFRGSVELLLQTQPLAGSPYVAKALLELVPAISHDLRCEQSAVTDTLGHGTRSFAVLPLIAQGKALGVLAIHAEVAGFFDHAEVQMLRDLASNIAFALGHLSAD